MIEKDKHFKPPVQKLFDLANNLLDPQSFRLMCEEFSTFDETNSTDNYWRFQITEKTALLVGIDDNKDTNKKQVTSAILSFCWWDSFLKSDHKTFLLFY